MLSIFERTGSQLEKKQGRLDELNQLWAKFDEQNTVLLTLVNGLVDKINKAKVITPSQAGVKAYQEEIKDCETALQTEAPQFEEFRDLGRQIAAMDNLKSQRVQKDVGEVEAAWDRLLQLLESRVTSAATVAGVWNQFAESSATVQKVLKNVQPVVEQEMKFSSQADVKHALEQVKVNRLVADV
jgi:hypothetical protein